MLQRVAENLSSSPEAEVQSEILQQCTLETRAYTSYGKISLRSLGEKSSLNLKDSALSWIREELRTVSMSPYPEVLSEILGQCAKGNRAYTRYVKSLFVARGSSPISVSRTLH